MPTIHFVSLLIRGRLTSIGIQHNTGPVTENRESHSGPDAAPPVTRAAEEDPLPALDVEIP